MDECCEVQIQFPLSLQQNLKVTEKFAELYWVNFSKWKLKAHFNSTFVDRSSACHQKMFSLSHWLPLRLHSLHCNNLFVYLETFAHLKFSIFRISRNKVLNNSPILTTKCVVKRNIANASNPTGILAVTFVLVYINYQFRYISKIQYEICKYNQINLRTNSFLVDRFLLFLVFF